MNARYLRIVAAAIVGLVGLVALALPLREASAQTPPAVTVYDATQVPLGSYTVVKRLGIGDWRSAFGIGGHDDLEKARGALLAQAADVGADGVINLVCFDKTDRLFSTAGYYCYGNAVSLKK